MSTSQDIPREAIREQLERICQSPVFVHSERTSAFLRYTVEEALDGRGAQLKEFSIGVDVFHRDESFDPRVNAIVRVEATRVRGKLREYYGTDGAEDPVRIDLPKGAYVPEFRAIPEAPKRTGHAGAQSPPDAGSSAWALGPRWVPVVLVVALLTGAVYFTGSIVWTGDAGLKSTGEGPPLNSVAVLPLRNLSGKPEAEYLTIGMTDALITALAKNRSLRITSMTSTLRYKDADRLVSEIARELNVGYVVEGSVLHAEQSVHVNAQLIAGATDQHVWADEFDRPLEDALTLQDEIARQIAVAVLGDTASGASSGVVQKTTLSPEAQEAYLKGVYFRSKLTAGGFYKGTEFFKKTIDMAPQFSPAYTGLASCYCLLGGHGLELVEPAIGMPAAKAALTKALELDPSAAEPQVYVGIIRLKYEWDFAGAERAFRTAIDLNPSLFRAHLFYSFYLEAMGRHQESIVEAHVARELNPLSLAANVNLGWQYLQADNPERALTFFNTALELDADFWGAHWGLGHYHRRRGDYARAIDAFEKAVALKGGHSLAISALGYTLAVAGQRDRAQQTIEQLKRLSNESYVPPFHTATVYVGLGEHEKALDWLERAFHARSRSMAWLNVASEYDVLRSDERFQDLIRRVGLEPPRSK